LGEDTRAMMKGGVCKLSLIFLNLLNRKGINTICSFDLDFLTYVLKVNWSVHAKFYKLVIIPSQVIDSVTIYVFIFKLFFIAHTSTKCIFLNSKGMFLCSAIL
jgi:hypothetical protein